MSDRTQDLKNLRAVATACKNYVDETKEQILWQVGQYDITTQDDNTTAYQKVVPTGATRAKLKSIGGMSYKSENILPTDKLGSGVVVNNDTMSITDSTSGMYILNEITLPAGTYVMSFILFTSGLTTSHTFTPYVSETIIDGFSNFNEYTVNQVYTRTFTLTQTSTFKIRQWQGASESYSFRLWMNKNTAKDYNTYFSNIRDSAVPSVKSTSSDLKTNMNYGYYIDDDGVAQTDNNSLYFDVLNVKANTEYYLNVAGLENSTNISVFFYDYSQQEATKIMLSRGYFTTPLGTDQVSISIYNERNNYTDAYVGEVINTFTIPDEIQSLTGYGRGINENCYNILDLESKSYTQKVASYTFTGNETLTEYTRSSDSKKTYAVAINGRATTTNVLFESLSLSTATTMNTMEDNSYRGATDTSSVIFYSTSYQTSASMLAFLTGKTIYFELATPQETDISQYIDNNVIEVEEGGYLVFENPYGQVVPSNITYRIEVAR